MQKKLIARTAKLSSESKKSRHFKGAAITYEHIPKDLDERNHGSIYAVINIDADTDTAQEITEIIIDAFHGEYYQDLNRDPLASFEATLTKINEELADATHQGKISWLNHLNAVLAVLSGTTFHLTQAGKAEAYLYRGEKSSHVSDDLAGDSSNPLRTFINIASGSLVESDKIAIVSPGVFFHISKDELKKYVQEFQPRVAISHIADLIEGTTTEMKPNAVLILEAITAEAASNETLNEQPDEVWITEPTKPLETAIDTAKPIVKKTGSFLSTAWAATSTFVIEKAVPVVKDFSADSIENYKKWQKKREKIKRLNEQVLVDTEESLSGHPTNSYESEELEDVVEEKIETKAPVATAPKPNEIYIKEEQKQRAKWIKLEKVNFSVAQKFGTKIKNSTQRVTKNRSLLLIASIVVLVAVIGGGYVVWQKREAAENLRLAQASLTEAQGKYDSATAALAAGERKTAIDNLNDAESIVKNIKNNQITNDVAALSDKIKTAIDQAKNITRIDSNPIADASSIVGNNPMGPYLINSNLYLINPENGTIAEISTKNGEVSNVLDKPNITGKITSAAAVTARRILAIMTDQALYEFDPTALTIKKQETNSTQENSKSLAAFSTNLYSLDSGNGKVFKRTKITGGYGSPTNYISDGSAPTNTISIAIDSNLYLLNVDGTVTKYLSGKKQDFELTELPFAIQKASTIFTDEDTNGLYLVDAGQNLVVRFDDKGKYVTAFTSDGMSNLNGVVVSDADKTGYASANGKVYKFSI